MIPRGVLFLAMLLCLASCGIAKTDSHFLRKDTSAPASLPTKTVLQLCGTDPSVRFAVMDALVASLSKTGIEVRATVDLPELTGVCEGATIPEVAAKHLWKNLGIKGIFVGTLRQSKIEPFLLTALDLKLIGNPGGRPLWSTNVKIDQLAAAANAKKTAVKAAVLAADSFAKDNNLSGNSEKSK